MNQMPLLQQDDAQRAAYVQIRTPFRMARRGGK